MFSKIEKNLLDSKENKELFKIRYNILKKEILKYKNYKIFKKSIINKIISDNNDLDKTLEINSSKININGFNEDEIEYLSENNNVLDVLKLLKYEYTLLLEFKKDKTNINLIESQKSLLEMNNELNLKIKEFNRYAKIFEDNFENLLQINKNILSQLESKNCKIDKLIKQNEKWKNDINLEKVDKKVLKNIMKKMMNQEKL